MLAGKPLLPVWQELLVISQDMIVLLSVSPHQFCAAKWYCIKADSHSILMESQANTGTSQHSHACMSDTVQL